MSSKLNYKRLERWSKRADHIRDDAFLKADKEWREKLKKKSDPIQLYGGTSKLRR